MAPPGQDTVAPTPPWFCLTPLTLKRSQTFQMGAQTLKKLGNIQSQQEVTQYSKSCPALSGVAPQSCHGLVSPAVTQCHPWVSGALDQGQAFPWEKLFQPNHPGHSCSWHRVLAQTVTFQVVALGTKCPGASWGHSGPSQQIQTGNTGSGSRGVSLPQGVIPYGAGCHPRSPPSSRAEAIQGSSGIEAVPVSSGSGILGILGFYKPFYQDPTLVWDSLLGILRLPVTSERPFPCPYPFHPCPSNLPVFPWSNFTNFEDQPFSILSSCFPCNPCNSQGSVPRSSSPWSLLFSCTSRPHSPPESGPSSDPTESHIPSFCLFEKSRPFISQILGCQRVETFPGNSVGNGIFNDGSCSPALSEFSWFFYGIAVNSGNNGSTVR